MNKILKSEGNHLNMSKYIEQGAMKMRNSKLKKSPKKMRNDIFYKTKPHNNGKQSEESDEGEDMVGMVEKKDLDFLKNAIASRSYSIFENLHSYGAPKTKQLNLHENTENLEEEYEEQLKETFKKCRSSLPIKAKEGFIPQRVFAENDVGSMANTRKIKENSENEEIIAEYTSFESPSEDLVVSKPISAAQIISQRNKFLCQRKMEIGVLSAQLLENADESISNLRILLRIMDEQNSEVYLTVRKLAIASLLEVFKDIIPSYRIRRHQDEKVILKKSTLKLRKFESELLQHYKKYLRKLEKSCMVLQENTAKHEEGKMLGQFALHSMCDLLVNQPYFNFSENISQFVVPFLNHKDVYTRKLVKSAIKTVFEEDKRKDVTLKILRIIYHYLKTHSHYCGLEILEVLFVLKLRELNYEDEELCSKRVKLSSKTQNVIQISRKEIKRKKQLKRLEHELLETKAEENQRSKHKNITEITKIVFSIYFMILKSSTNKKAVGVCLEGLAKFAHCINLSYYMDIVHFLDKWLKDKSLLLPQQLHCIKTVFVILNRQGETLNLDPIRFYNHIYNNLLDITANSKIHYLQLMILHILCDSLIKRRKKITIKRMIGFMKRLTVSSLQLLHHGALGILRLISINLRSNKFFDIILDTESIGDYGIYMSELDDPEYPNASSTALYELIILQKHYHPIVGKFSENIASGLPSTGEGSLVPELTKSQPEEIFQEFDMTGMTFNPPVPVPKNSRFRAKMKYNNLLDSNFESYCIIESRNQIKKGNVCTQ